MKNTKLERILVNLMTILFRVKARNLLSFKSQELERGAGFRKRGLWSTGRASIG